LGWNAGSSPDNPAPARGIDIPPAAIAATGRSSAIGNSVIDHAHGAHALPYELDTSLNCRVEEPLVEPFAVNVKGHGLKPQRPPVEPKRRPANQAITSGRETMDLSLVRSDLVFDKRITLET
jgi:hypothetical protein